jgi:putative DNA primase/helicase
MSAINYDDVVAQISAIGIVLDKPLNLDSRIQRWKVDGEDRERRGWTRLKEWTSRAGHLYIVGVYGVWHGTDDGKIKVELPRNDPQRPALTPEDVIAMRAAQKEADKRIAAERKAEAKRAAQWAASVWARCAPATEHEYLARKRIDAHGARLMGDGADLQLPGIDESNFYRLKCAAGALVVPMHDEHGNVCGIQWIYPKGHERREKLGRDKEFWPRGMAMGGSFGLIGHIKREGIILIAEGYATAATLHEATGQTVAYAFSANNLAKTGKLLRRTCPRARLLFCADDDYLTDGNPGCTYAAQAHGEIEGSAWTKPDFSAPGESGETDDLRGGKKLTDYNDLAVLTGGHVAVALQINAKLDALGWRDAPTPGASRGGSDDKGGGESGGAAGANTRKRAQAVMNLDDIVARFIPIDDGTGKYVFDTWTARIAQREQMITLLPAGVRGDDIKRHPVWIERGAYYLDQVGFDPGGTDDNVALNTWKGWPLVAKPGRCTQILELLEYLCSGEKNGRDVYQWVLRWMAYPLQHPGAKMASAVIMHGPQGTGKSCVFQTLAKIYGDYSTVLNQRGLEDKFNSDWADSKLFILAEEVVTRAEMWHIKNELKELVTGDWIRINPKNVAAYRQRNHVNIAYLSNEGQPLPLENDDRRHLVIWTPPMLSEAYYDDVFREIDNGGVAAFYDYLLTLDLGDFHPKKRPPMTDSKQKLIDLSMPSEMRFIADYLREDTRWPVCPAQRDDFYGAYVAWCKANGERNPRSSSHFMGYLDRQAGWKVKKCRVYGNDHYSGPTTPAMIVIPPVEAIQATGGGKYVRRPDEEEVVWRTRSVFAFKYTEKDDAKSWESAA